MGSFLLHIAGIAGVFVSGFLLGALILYFNVSEETQKGITEAVKNM